MQLRELRKSLYFRLSSLLLLVLLVLGALQVGCFAYLFVRLTDQKEQVLNWKLAAHIKPDVERMLNARVSHSELAEYFRQRLLANPRVDYYLLDESGRIVADFAVYGTGRPATAVPLDQIRAFLSSSPLDAAPLYGVDPWTFRSTGVFSVAPVEAENFRGYLYAVLANRRSKVAQGFYGENAAMVFSAVGSFAAVVVVGSLGVYLFGLLTRRFRRLTEIVEKYREGNFIERIEVENDDDIAMLSQAVNSMADKIVDNLNQLELRDKTRRDLIANVSHDLRGPVNSMGGFVAELKSLEQALQSERLKEVGAALSRNTSSLRLLLDELFELAKLEAKEKRLERGPLSVGDLFTDLEQRFLPKAQRLDLELSFSAPDELPEVYADAGLIERVLWNLIDNALRYTPAGGQVSVQATHSDNQVWVEVRDTGPGISQEDLPYIYEKYRLAQTSTPREGVSSGLGLALVKKIIEAHDSSISASSEVGRGTAFRFSLEILDPDTD